MSACEQYVCSLDKPSLKKAAEELNEDPKERDSAVASFRQWIEQNNAWLKTPTDTKFLLGFLRNAKFAQLAARKRFVKFWTSRTKNKEWFANTDVLDETITKCMKMGTGRIDVSGKFTVDDVMKGFVPIIDYVLMDENVQRDKEGRTILLGRTGRIDVSGKFTVDDVMKGFVPIIDYVLMDENVQVNGCVIIEDMGDLTIKHQTFFGMEPMKKSMNAFINGYPVRYKSMHYYNTNPIFEAMFTIISPLMPEKLKKRLHFHGKKLTSVYKCIDQECLPQEYLPDDFKGDTVGTIQDCIDNMINNIQKPEIREYLLRLSSPEYGVIESLKPSDDELFSEAFRQLNVD